MWESQEAKDSTGAKNHFCTVVHNALQCTIQSRQGVCILATDTKSICGDIHDLVTPVSNDAPHQPANYFVCLSDFDGKLNQRIVQLLGTGSMGFICFFVS